LRTLRRYIANGKIPTPRQLPVGDTNIRLWSAPDIERVRRILPKLINGRKTRYQKERAKKKGSRKASKKK
jgi:DNA-binding transcriptional MerR regulator